MKRAISKKQSRIKPRAVEEDGLLPEYDFSKGVRNKYAQAFRQGFDVTIHKADGSMEVQRFEPSAEVVILDQDVRKFFPTAEAVNNALRGLIALIPRRPRKPKTKSQAV